MTHDELLARIDNVTYAHDNGHTIDKDRIVKQLNGLRAVVELHKPWEFDLDSGEVQLRCSCDDCTDGYSLWPCNTIQTILEQLK